MKKIFTVFVAIIVFFGITGCGGPKTYDEVSMSELNKMISNKENFVLVIGSKTCSACQAFKPTMERIIKNYKLDIKYIDISKLSDEELGKLTDYFNFSGTPVTVFVTKGKEKDTYNRIEGNQRYSKVVEKLKKNGYIKE